MVIRQVQSCVLIGQHDHQDQINPENCPVVMLSHRPRYSLGLCPVTRLKVAEK